MPVFTVAQRKLMPPPSSPPTKADEACAEARNQCSNNHTYTVQQRRAFYPFNAAAEVRLLSYKFFIPHNSLPVEKEIAGIEPGYVFSGVNPGEFIVDYSRVNEYKNLLQGAIDSLTDILYNIGYTPKTCNMYIEDPGANCYEPRNAIVFIDKQGKVIQYIEICFGCQRMYRSSAKIKKPVFCEQKYDIIRRFFVAQGIQYGTAGRTE